MRIRDLFDSNNKINWEFVNTIPEIKALIGCQQNTDWHQEGDAYNHTKLVVQEMEKIIAENKINAPAVQTTLLAAALLHDIGKPPTTYYNEDEGQWKTQDHGLAGDKIVRRLFFDEPDVFKREAIAFMVRNHMTLHYIYGWSDKYKKKLIKLSYGHAPLQYMMWLNLADSHGSISYPENETEEQERIDLIAKMVDTLDIRWNPYLEYMDRVTRYNELNNLNLNVSDIDQTTELFDVIIMCGLAGSGKSTFIKDNYPKLPVISRDVMRYEMGLTSSPDEKIIARPDQEKKITKMMNDRIIELCKAGQSFVIDNMNLRYIYRQAVLKMVLPYNARITLAYVEAPDVETCIKRREGQIPAEEYDRIMNNFIFPQPYEYDELIIAKQGDGGAVTITQRWEVPTT